jgi:hypothetical protein
VSRFPSYAKGNHNTFSKSNLNILKHMKKYCILISLSILMVNHSYSYCQDFLPKNQKTRAYTVPIGTTKTNHIIGDSSKTYKIVTPKFNKAIKLSIYQSDYDKAQDKTIDHLLYENNYKQGDSMFFSIVINENENKYFILVPGSFMGQLNFPCNKSEQIKYVQAQTGSNNFFIFYIDKEDKIEHEIEKYKYENEIGNDSDLNKALSIFDKFHIIHYKYE